MESECRMVARIAHAIACRCRSAWFRRHPVDAFTSGADGATGNPALAGGCRATAAHHGLADGTPAFHQRIGGPGAAGITASSAQRTHGGATRPRHLAGDSESRAGRTPVALVAGGRTVCRLHRLFGCGALSSGQSRRGGDAAECGTAGMAADGSMAGKTPGGEDHHPRIKRRAGGENRSTA